MTKLASIGVKLNEEDEAYRHECEVRQVIDWRKQNGKQWLRDFLDQVEMRRGNEARDKLASGVTEAWSVSK